MKHVKHELITALNEHLTASKRASGGSAANSIIAASYFGSKVFYSCKVANDESGEFYLRDLKEAGVTTKNDSRETGITGKCLVMITADAERSMNTFLGISETLSPANLDETALANSQWLYYEGYLVTSDTGRATAIRAREIAEQKNVKTAISLSDPGMVQFFKKGLLEMIGNGVDLIFCNEEEALKFTDTDNIDAAIENLKLHSKAVAITLGAKGAIAFDGQTLHHIAANPTTAIDSNGAGDAFAGAFLHAISQGLSYDKAGALASKISSQVVSQYGPRLSKAQYQAFLSA